MTLEAYQFWSKSSIYLKAVRDEKLNCCLSTFYKYCRLLGYSNVSRYRKSDNYNPVRTTEPNELWCADVTIFQTADGVKQYIHFIIDHFSKMILGYRVEKSSSGEAIRDLLRDATLKYKPNQLTFLTDAGSENVNNTVSSFLNGLAFTTKHIIAQKDVVFSNSLMEAINKIIKYNFLHPKTINSGKQLITVLDESIPVYNTVRPQWSLAGNTPIETYNRIPLDFSKYKVRFSEQKTVRLAQNKQNNCLICH